MNKIFLLTSFLFFAISWAYSQTKPATNKITSEEEYVEVILGLDKLMRLNFTPNQKISIGDESVLTYELYLQRKELILKGLKKGQTNLTLRDENGDPKKIFIVKITEEANSKIVTQLRELLGDIEGIEIGIKGGKVYVGGGLVVPSDVGRIQYILSLPEFNKLVLNMVELAPQTKQIMARKMQEQIQKAGLRDVQVRLVNGSYWLEGIVKSGGEKQRAFDLAKAFFPDRIATLAERTDTTIRANREPIQNFISVNKQSKPPPIPKMVKIVTQFVELKKDYSKTFGFQWAPALGGNGGSIQFGQSAGGVTTQSNGTLAGTISNLFPKLASAKAAGYARELQSGIIVTKNGKKATIKKEHKTNYSIGTGERSRAVTASSVFELAVTPQVGQKENVNLNVQLTATTKAGGSSPEPITNNLATELLVKNKESAVVGGVSVHLTSTDFDRNPPFQEAQIQNPVNDRMIFNFLRSKNYANNRSQFVVFITPEIIKSASEGVNEIKRKFRRRTRN